MTNISWLKMFQWISTFSNQKFLKSLTLKNELNSNLNFFNRLISLSTLIDELELFKEFNN